MIFVTLKSRLAQPEGLLLSRLGQQILLDREPLTGGRWVTIEGEHIYIKDGKIAAGPENLVGKKPEDLPSREEEKPKEPTAEEKIAHPDAQKAVDKMKGIEEKYKAKAKKLDGPIDKLQEEIQQHLDTQTALRIATPVISERTSPSKYGGPTVQEHIDAIEKIVDDKVGEIQALVSKRVALSDAQRKEAFKTVIGDKYRELGGNIQITKKEHGEAEPEGVPDIKKGVKAFRQMMGAGGRHAFWPDVKVTAIPKPQEGASEDASDNYNRQRSYAENDAFSPTVRLGKNAGQATTIHELGHIAELVDPEVRDAAQAFVDRRTAGLPVKKLSEITGSTGFKDHEIASEGAGFIDPYVGKHYQLKLDLGGGKTKMHRYATEVTSIGLEHMYRDPVTFAKTDPDHFKLIYSMMHRS